MPDVILIDLVKEWLDNRWDMSCSEQTIIHPCECGSNSIYASVNDDNVVLTQACCTCEDCARVQILAGDPKFFDILEKSLQSRIDHKSVVISNYVKTGDDIQHAIDHFQNHKEIYLDGKFENQKINLKDHTIVINGGNITGCEFNNINAPISITGEVVVLGCTFIMGPKSSYINYGI